MFLPLNDFNPLRNIRYPWVSHGLIALNSVIFLSLLAFTNEAVQQALNIGLGLIPAVLTNQAYLDATLAVVPPLATIVTHMFMHGGFAHIIGNMLFLWVFSDNIEDSLGHVKFILFYFGAGAAGAAAHIIAMPESQSPLIGASSAVSGVVAAYLLLHPRAALWVLVLKVIPVEVKAYWALGAWVIFQIWSALASTDHQIGWWAHVGGFIGGIFLLLILRRKDRAPLFANDPETTTHKEG